VCVCVCASLCECVCLCVCVCVFIPADARSNDTDVEGSTLQQYTAITHCNNTLQQHTPQHTATTHCNNTLQQQPPAGDDARARSNDADVEGDGVRRAAAAAVAPALFGRGRATREPLRECEVEATEWERSEASRFESSRFESSRFESSRCWRITEASCSFSRRSSVFFSPTWRQKKRKCHG